MKRPLTEYRSKRDFTRTSEPSPDEDAEVPAGRLFVVQKHAATRLHWDFRLEWGGVLLSWAVTRGPSADPSTKRLAVRTEDHPLAYATFEGVIPKPEYGAGRVMLWDRGSWAPLGDVEIGLTEGMLKFILLGERMRGLWMLVRMAPRPGEKRGNWLLIKERDPHVDTDPEGLVTRYLTSIATGRTMDDIAVDTKCRSRAKGQVQSKVGLKAPPFQPVQLAKLHTSVPKTDDWLHEVKVDGYRCLAAVGAGQVRLYTRSGLDWTTEFGGLTPAFEKLPCDTALVDGEVVALGVQSNAFSALQTRLKQGGPLGFVAFDLLHLNGRDLTSLPLIDRKSALKDLLVDCCPEIQFSTHIQGRGPEAMAEVCRAGREGLVSKLANAPYRAGRRGSWLKLKCTRRQEFVIGGWSPSTSKGRPFASLLLGSFENEQLVYRGRVGSGFGAREFDELMPRLTALSQSAPPFIDAPPDLGAARWVSPDLVAEIKFAELTAEGLIRHGTYQALRQDKPPKHVSLDQIAEEKVTIIKGKDTQVIKVKGVAITNPDRPVFQSPMITKAQVAHHYANVARRMLHFTRDRPISLLRCPDGIAGPCFFQKHLGEGMPKQLKPVAVSDKDGDADYISLSTEAGLVAGAQMGTIEYHICGARNAALDLPDRMVFDLDPDEGLGFSAVRRAALDLRVLLEELGLPSVAMLSGGKGIHVIVALKPQATWETVKLFSHTIAVMLAEAEPHRFIASMSKAKRKGLIFIDWLRNERGATAVAPYSLRARPGAKVAVPVTWEELLTVKAAGKFDTRSVIQRLETPCPLQQATQRAKPLGKTVLAKLEKRLAHW